MVKKLAILSMLVILMLASSCRYITGEAPETTPATTPAPSTANEAPIAVPAPSRTSRNYAWTYATNRA